MPCDKWRTRKSGSRKQVGKKFRLRTQSPQGLSTSLPKIRRFPRKLIPNQVRHQLLINQLRIMSPQQYIAFRDQVERGTKVEMEHTNDKWVARKIALDHLQENLRYYDYLEKMEKKMKIEEPHSGIARAKWKWIGKGKKKFIVKYKMPNEQGFRIAHIKAKDWVEAKKKHMPKGFIFVWLRVPRR